MAKVRFVQHPCEVQLATINHISQRQVYSILSDFWYEILMVMNSAMSVATF